MASIDNSYMGTTQVFYVPEALSHEVSGDALSVTSFLSRKEVSEAAAYHRTPMQPPTHETIFFSLAGVS